MNKRIQLQQNLDFFKLSLLSKENIREKSEYNRSEDFMDLKRIFYLERYGLIKPVVVQGFLTEGAANPLGRTYFLKAPMKLIGNLASRERRRHALESPTPSQSLADPKKNLVEEDKKHEICGGWDGFGIGYMVFKV